MKGFSILCDSANLAEARQSLKAIFGTDNILTKPASKNGTEPATHWYSYVKMEAAAVSQLVIGQMYCTVDEASPKEFLQKRSLKLI
jgi:hypothetical protein